MKFLSTLTRNNSLSNFGICKEREREKGCKMKQKDRQTDRDQIENREEA